MDRDNGRPGGQKGGRPIDIYDQARAVFARWQGQHHQGGTGEVEVPIPPPLAGPIFCDLKFQAA
jgi:hypothetical protein